LAGVAKALRSGSTDLVKPARLRRPCARFRATSREAIAAGKMESYGRWKKIEDGDGSFDGMLEEVEVLTALSLFAVLQSTRVQTHNFPGFFHSSAADGKLPRDSVKFVVLSNSIPLCKPLHCLCCTSRLQRWHRLHVRRCFGRHLLSLRSGRPYPLSPQEPRDRSRCKPCYGRRA